MLSLFRVCIFPLKPKARKIKLGDQCFVFPGITVNYLFFHLAVHLDITRSTLF